MRSLYLASIVGIVSSTDIIAYRLEDCIRTVLPVTTCLNVPSNFCCVFAELEEGQGRIQSVYVGKFNNPTGCVATWHTEGTGSACGRSMDADGSTEDVCMTDTRSVMYTGSGGGAMWFPLPYQNPAKSRTGTTIPAIAPPVGFANLAPFGASGLRKERRTSLEDREAERRDDQNAMSMDEFQVRE